VVEVFACEAKTGNRLPPHLHWPIAYHVINIIADGIVDLWSRDQARSLSICAPWKMASDVVLAQGYARSTT